MESGEEGDRLSVDLPADAHASGDARRAVRLALERWGRLDLLDRALVIASELAGNAVRHATGPLRLTIRVAGRRVSIAVHDRTAQLPRTGLPQSLEAESGRGLVLIDALADESGHRETAEGKVVWASLTPDVKGPASSDDADAPVARPTV